MRMKDDLYRKQETGDAWRTGMAFLRALEAGNFVQISYFSQVDIAQISYLGGTGFKP
jgi:hypothetical protein